MVNDISCGTRDNEQECLANSRLVYQIFLNTNKGQWSFIGLGSEKKLYSMEEDSPQGIWDHIAEKMLIEFTESTCPIFPCSDSIVQDTKNCRFTIVPTRQRLRFFRILVSANQLSLYGAVAEMCEEYETLPDRSGRLDADMGQSIVFSAIKTSFFGEWWSSISEFSFTTIWRTNLRSYHNKQIE